MTTPIPALPSTCNSWVVTSPAGTVYEFGNRRNVEKAAAAGWRIETAAEYLGRINQEIRSTAA